MKPSLSVLLPVHNAEDRLAEEVTEILDVLPELSNAFELVIIDDGSTDDTIDVATDLAVRFPQVRVARHPLRLGLEESIQTGLDHSDGAVVFVGDENYGIEVDDLRKLWTNGAAAAVESPEQPSGPRWLAQLLGWTPSATATKATAMQILRRPANRRAAEPSANEMRELERRVDAHCKAARAPARPKFIDKAKRFAWGE